MMRGSVPSTLINPQALFAMQMQLKNAVEAGLSYAMTGENNGQPSSYAFSELELVCMPPGWRPAWHLCGKVMS